MKVTVKGKLIPVTLDQSNYRGGGGEGEVFVSNNRAYKVYHDPTKMLPTGKITELQALSANYIFKPENILLDEKNAPIGYDMKAMPQSEPLCKLFTKDYRNANNITPDMILHLVKKLHEGLQFCHDQNILAVDVNEMNFLFNKRLTECYFIDCDSYKTTSYPATALMLSVRDPVAFKSNRYDATELTDWYSYAILTFQMIIGIHPFRGGNTRFDHISKKDSEQLLARMAANVSVLNKETKLPAVCQPLTNIPAVYRQWYEAVFERGLRMAPPTDFTATIVLVPTVTTISGSNNFTIEWVAGHVDTSVVSGRTPKQDHWITAEVINGQLELVDRTTGKQLVNMYNVDSTMSYKGRIYYQSQHSINEVEYLELATGTLISPRKVSSILENGTTLYQGVAIQNLLGGYYASLFPDSGTCYEVRIKELDKYRVIDARYDYGVLVVIAEKGGKYDRFVFRMATDYKSYDVRIASDISTHDINFTVLDTGVALLVNENEELELFSNRKDSSAMKVVFDPAIDGSCKLSSKGGQAFFTKGDKLYKFTLKK